MKDNRDRDAATTIALEDQGWTVLRFWEHEDLELAAEEIKATVERRKAVL
ncbi:very short patch repair endonuclease [Streptomyces murinus]|nr:very short patch repair endonuclease [Streptomyces murinus]